MIKTTKFYSEKDMENNKKKFIEKIYSITRSEAVAENEAMEVEEHTELKKGEIFIACLTDGLTLRTSRVISFSVRDTENDALIIPHDMIKSMLNFRGSDKYDTLIVTQNSIYGMYSV